MKRLVCFGSCCIDYYSNLDGGKAFVGGGPLNTAVYAAETGLPVSLISCIGNDPYSDMILQYLQQKQIDLSHLHRAEGKTACTGIRIAGNDSELCTYEEGVLKQFRLSEDDIAFIKNHDAAVFDLWSRQEDFLPAIRSDGLLLAFDAADRPDDPAAVKAQEYCDLFFFLCEEDSESVVGQMLEILRRGPSLVIALCGARGSICMDKNGIHRYQITPEKEIVDTVGAVDCYIASFLKEWLEGKEVEECMRTASAAVLPVLQFYGACRQ